MTSEGGAFLREVSMTSSKVKVEYDIELFGTRPCSICGHMCIYIAVTKPGRGQAARESAALGFSLAALLQLLYFSCFRV
jgi:hypothetical protein